MINRFVSKPSSMSWRRRFASMALAGLAGATFLGAAGCDTVALISFSERRFLAMQPVGVTAPAGQCEGITDELSLRFVLMANDNTPIRPGEVVGLQEIDLRREDISIANGRVFTTPDTLCESAAACGSGYICEDAISGDNDARNRCHKVSELTVPTAPAFIADTSKRQLFGVLYENSGSLRGWLPSEVGALYPVDADGVRVPGTSQDPSLNYDRASDRYNERIAALAGIVNNWGTAAETAQNDGGRSTSFGLWSFAGSRAQVLSYVPSSTGQVWTRSPQTANQAYNDMRDVSADATRANVFEALSIVLDDGYGSAEHADADKTLVVFVDGPDDRVSPNHTIDSVIAQARQYGVRVFVVHLDAALKNPELIRDDFKYYEAQDPCTSDAECKNFEECRTPQFFSVNREGGNVTYPQDTTATYCMPRRDDNGRIGPIDEYARLACETEGGYIYVPAASALRNRIEALPFTMDGLWEVPVEVTEAARGTLQAGSPYRVQGDMTITVNEERSTVSFSQLGDRTNPEDDGMDTRPAFFTAP